MMAEIPKVPNCPIRCEEDGICMCAVRKCTEVDLRECFQMRSAYSYGFTTAEDIAIKHMDEIKNTIDGIIKRTD
jgi:hypothetical protein